MFFKVFRRIFVAGSIIIFISLCSVFVLSLGAALTPLTAAHNRSVPSAVTAAGNTGAFFYLAQVLKPAVYTVKIALCSTLIAVTTGVAAAFFTANRRFFGRRFLLVFSAVPLSIPPLLIALGFVLAFGINGSINRFIASAGTALKTAFGVLRVQGAHKAPADFLYSFWGIVIVQGFYNFPLVMRLCTDVWQRLPADEADAARLLGASERKVFRTVTFYQLAPTIASAAMLVFLYCFFSFIIVLLFGSAGGTTLEVAVYRSLRASLDFKQGAVFALAETLIALCFVLLYARLEFSGRKSGGITGEAKIFNSKKLRGVGEYIFFAAVFILVIAFFFVPLFSVSANAFVHKKMLSFAAFGSVLSRPTFWLSLKNTVYTSAVSAALAVTGACVYAVFVRSADPLKTKTWLRLIPLMPMAVSSIVIGFGMIVFFRKGSPLSLIAAQSALGWPLAFRSVSSAMDRIPQSTLNAARLLSADFSDSVFRIQLPLLRRSIFSAFGFCFASASADASLPLILSIPRFETLALFTYRLAGSYRFSEACAAGSMLAALTILFFILGDKLK